MRRTLAEVLVVATLVLIVFSMFSVISPVRAQSGGSPEYSCGVSGGSVGEDYPISNFTDFQNGTTLTIIDYGNGTLDETFETLVNKTATLDFLNEESNQSISLLLQNRTIRVT